MARARRTQRPVADTEALRYAVGIALVGNRGEADWDELDAPQADAVIVQAQTEPIEAGRERLLTGTCGLIDEVQLVLLDLGIDA